MPRRAFLLTCILFHFLGFALPAGQVIQFDLTAGQVSSVKLDSPVDDSNFLEPIGYAEHGARMRSFTRTIELKNTASKPLIGRLLVVNDNDWSNFDSLRRALRLDPEPARHRATIERLFTFWKNHRSHAGTSCPLSEQPFATINFWGFTLCGDDTRAFARIAYACGIPARYVQLNGHIAAEYQYGDAWHVVDGDQNTVYLRLDNRTLASFEDLRNDPFLALRTHVFGKHTPFSLTANSFNCALFEHVHPDEPKQLRFKTGPAPLNDFSVEPGESIIWHCDTPPEPPIGNIVASNPLEVKNCLATIEHRIDPSRHRIQSNHTITVHSPFPIFKAINVAASFSWTPKPGEVAFTVRIPIKDASDSVAVFSQCARNAIPFLTHGDNTVALRAETGTANVTVTYDPAPDLKPPEVAIRPVDSPFSAPPAFSLASKSSPKRIWWQISQSRDFGFVAPSLESVEPWSRDLHISLLADTFLSPNRPYYLRVKAATADCWGPWSQSCQFQVTKPSQPSGFHWSSSDGAKVRLDWIGDPSAEFSVYGSNRIDFIPEPFAQNEITKLNHFTVAGEHANHNLVARVTRPGADFEPRHRFYRVIARKGGAWGVPGILLRLPAEFSKGLPPPSVLQIRASNSNGKDVYEGTEEIIPNPPSKP